MSMTYDEKKKALIAYAEKFPINELPGFTNIMTIDSKHIRVSDSVLNLVGYKSHDQIFETDYYSIPCQVSENSENFEKEDQIALSEEIKVLSYHNFHDGWKILLGHKKFISRENEVIGTLANFIDVTACSIVDIGRYLLEQNKKIKKKQFSYIIRNNNEVCGLTKKEQECLFFFLRGLSYKEIAIVLNIGITTVQTHIEHIKERFDVRTRSQLIEKAVYMGFMCIVPETLFK